MTQLKKWTVDLNRVFSKEEIKMTKKHLEKCLSSVAMKAIQFKITLRCHLAPVRMVKINKTTDIRCW